MIAEENLIAIGKLFKPHGYKGELNVEIEFGKELLSDAKIPFFVKMDNIPVPFFVERIGGGASGYSFLKFKGVDSDVEATNFVNKAIYVEKDIAAKVTDFEDDDLILADSLIGFSVLNGSDGKLLGMVTDIEEGIEYDYLVVELPGRESPLSIPLVDDYIEEISESDNEDNGFIKVNLPDGFLDI